MCLQACLVLMSYSRYSIKTPHPVEHRDSIKDITFFLKLCVPSPNHTDLFFPSPHSPCNHTSVPSIFANSNATAMRALYATICFALSISLQLDSSSPRPQAISKSLAGKRLLLSHGSGINAVGSLSVYFHCLT